MSEPVVVNLRFLAKELDLPIVKVQAVVDLLDEGHPVPFIARYRKDLTGNLHEDDIRAIQVELQSERALAERKQTILRTIESQGQLTPELDRKIRDAKTTKRLEDLYLPFKPKKQTLATIARSKGLEPLALEILASDPVIADLDKRAAEFINEDKGVLSVADALLGAGHIVSELFSEKIEIRQHVREVVQRAGCLVAKRILTKETTDLGEEVGENNVGDSPTSNDKGEATKGKKKAKKVKQEKLVQDQPATVETAQSPVETPQSLVETPQSPVEAPQSAEESREVEPSQAGCAVAEDNSGSGGGELENDLESTQPETIQESISTVQESISTVQESTSAVEESSTLPESSTVQESTTVEESPVEQGQSVDDVDDLKTISKLDDSRPNIETVAQTDQDIQVVEQQFQQWKEQQKDKEKPIVPSQNQVKKKRKAEKKKAKEARVKRQLDHMERLFHDYFDYRLEIRKIPPHQTLALNRGEKAKMIRVKLDVNQDELAAKATGLCVATDHPHSDFLTGCLRNAVERLILPSVEREVRADLTEQAELQSIQVFAKNLRNLLLQPPLRRQRVLAIDPGFKHGCKMVALDEFGNVLAHETVYLFGSADKKRRAEESIVRLIDEYRISVIAIGNGTACRETEEFISRLIAKHSDHPTDLNPKKVDSGSSQQSKQESVALQPTVQESAPQEPAVQEPVVQELVGQKPTEQAGSEEPSQPVEPKFVRSQAVADASYVVVNEAGASVYSASPLANEEFPNYDILLRGAISIGRRLQDPLNELVKVEPASLGVGMYQHDLKSKYLKDSLNHVVESCVNHVGVDLNTAGPAILRYVSGLNQLTAKRIYEYRVEHGPFKTREDLKKVPGLGEVTFTHCAGFLLIPNGVNPLDATWIHPEMYDATYRILEQMGYTVEDLRNPETAKEIAAKTKTADITAIADALGIGPITIRDILQQLGKPVRDPRERLSTPVFKKGILQLKDLSPDMELTGTVLNVVDFGAFIDIGLHESGLVHISQFADRYVRDAHEFVSVGNIVRVWVVEVDSKRNRISLTMIPPHLRKQEQREQRRDGSFKRDAESQHSGDSTSQGVRSSGPGKGLDQRQGSDSRSDRGSTQKRDGVGTVAETNEQRDSRNDSRKPGRTQGQGGAFGREGRPSEGQDSFRRNRRDGRDGRDGRNRGEVKPKVFVSAPLEKKMAPISEEMKKGKEPLRSFGDLAQLFGRVQLEESEKKKGKKDNRENKENKENKENTAKSPDKDAEKNQENNNT
ncbi:MAG: helix-hairpin-helix domain-containing protein [Thermoguttaceae bacterium]